MDEMTLYILAILVILFGKNILTWVQSLTSGTFTNGQAIPGSPSGLPFAPVPGATTTQNQAVNNPVATPAPWSNTCQATVQPPALSPIVSGVLSYPSSGTATQ